MPTLPALGFYAWTVLSVKMSLYQQTKNKHTNAETDSLVWCSENNEADCKSNHIKFMKKISFFTPWAALFWAPRYQLNCKYSRQKVACYCYIFSLLHLMRMRMFPESFCRVVAKAEIGFIFWLAAPSLPIGPLPLGRQSYMYIKRQVFPQGFHNLLWPASVP